MDKQSLIYDLFFIDRKNTIEISIELGVTKQYVAKILSTKYKEEYEAEKVARKRENARKRSPRSEDSDAYDLKSEHEISVRMMSKGSKLSDEASVYRNLNAYDVKGNRLVYNNRCGALPYDMKKSISMLKYSIYR